MSLDDATRDRLALAFADLAARAGVIAMEILAAPDIVARVKTDASPVCEADEKIEAMLLAELAAIAPGVPIIAEESTARGATPLPANVFLLVDPLDGTREFLARRDEFTINIALVADGAPRIGAVFAPALGELWFAGATAFGCRAAPGAHAPPPGDWRRLGVRTAPPQGPTALVSRSHLDEETQAFLRARGVTEIRETGSSVKFCRLAEGVADLYPRFGPTMEWDTAAGDAVLRAAGGAVLDPSGRPLRYGKAETGYRNGPFIALGDPAAARIC
ncbi:3'(2'),5'-bisphosphate nucleotidase CysQ [Methylosinus sp. Sm6]|uniref:3'(2'),5'-bisphosphate nucleotidase CysQ n=1 Tax=Methylosinus sp. Sm6 TaxID=2866948 RepID=UPI001C98F85B|nr:3'(2'),5'-bisphosphate nucleotidase CysQ [Methylosinus sp. Sm6]MBY6243116.1 3'(2'),5'-bisphosphate nucleotidase CysQ [Methylosinus sp. Sm6]